MIYLSDSYYSHEFVFKKYRGGRLNYIIVEMGLSYAELGLCQH